VACTALRASPSLRRLGGDFHVPRQLYTVDEALLEGAVGRRGQRREEGR